MTELKPCPMPKCPGHPNHSFMGKNNEIWCSECGFSVNGKDRYIVSLIWNNYSPQSLTEKVKWPEKYSKSNIEFWENENQNYRIGYNDGIDACKQSLNQASQEDTRELEDLINLHCQRIIDEGKVMLVYGGLARAILKEYVLVRKNEER